MSTRLPGSGVQIPTNPTGGTRRGDAFLHAQPSTLFWTEEYTTVTNSTTPTTTTDHIQTLYRELQHATVRDSTTGGSPPRERISSALTGTNHHRESYWLPGLYRDGFQYRFDGEMTGEQFLEASCTLGRDHAPQLLYDMWESGSLDIAKYPDAVTSAWSDPRLAYRSASSGRVAADVQGGRLHPRRGTGEAALQVSDGVSRMC